ncbi:MAG: M15 family metallopeptidase [Dehalococcoidia bacterium]|nr:M15 family metallopeptidase [Dehalococcoidia bacterium]
MYRYLNDLHVLRLAFLLVSASIAAITAIGCGDDPAIDSRTEVSDVTSVVGAPPRDDTLRVVSRAEPLPPDVAPVLVELSREVAAPAAGQLLVTQVTAAALHELVAAAHSAGHDVRVVAAFRSYADQEQAFQSLIARIGEARAVSTGTPPGTSEHQLGTAVDLGASSTEWLLDERFTSTPEFRWLQEHAHEFGFAASDPAEREARNELPSEPWHYRFVGIEHAARWHDSGVPLITYLRSTR